MSGILRLVAVSGCAHGVVEGSFVVDGSCCRCILLGRGLSISVLPKRDER